MKNKKRLIVLIVLLIIIIGFYFFTKGKKSVNSNQNIEQQAEVLQFDKVMVEGKGNEPGWIVKLNGNKLYQTTVLASMLLDYGDSTWAGTLDIVEQANYQDGFEYTGKVNQLIDNKVSQVVKNASVKVSKGECLDPKGDKHDYKVELNLNNEKTYQGCADVLE